MVAALFEPRVRETTSTSGLGTLSLAGRMFGSMSFAEACGSVDGSVFDYCIADGDSFEEGVGTWRTGGNLERTAIYRSRHIGGLIDGTKVNFTGSVKTIVATFGASRAALLEAGAVRFNVVQALTAPQAAQARANAPPFATGTRILFQQTTAPVGWTKDTAHNDKALRIVSGSVSSGGSSPFSTVFAKTATDSHAITQAELPNVNFSLSGITVNDSRTFKYEGLSLDTNVTAAGANRVTGYSGSFTKDVQVSGTITATGGNAASGGSGTAHTHPMDIRVNYVDAVICQKD
jgi:hypothetical protein